MKHRLEALLHEQDLHNYAQHTYPDASNKHLVQQKS